VQGVSIFITEKTMVEMFKLPKIGIKNLPPKLTKEKEKKNEVIIYQKIVP
jgi:hypothetical protein